MPDEVEAAVGFRFAQLEMEVRARRRARVARVAEHFALFDRPAVGFEPEVDAVRLTAVAFGLHMGGDVVAESLQMAVDSGRAVFQRQVDGSSVAVGRDDHARDIAVGNGHDRFTLRAVGFDVHTGMEMAGPYLAEIGGIVSGDLPHGKEVAGRVGGLRGSLRSGCELEHDEKGSGQNSSHGSGTFISWDTASSTAG